MEAWWNSMKLTKSKLQQIIKEEVEEFLHETHPGPISTEEKNLDEKKKKKMNIKKMKLKKGRCTPMGTPKCPEGSPQYNLAKRFKSGDIHKDNLKKGKNPHGPG